MRGNFEAAGCDIQAPRADVTVAAKRRRGSRLFHPRLRLPSSTQHLHSTGSKIAIYGPYARPAELPSSMLHMLQDSPKSKSREQPIADHNMREEKGSVEEEARSGYSRRRRGSGSRG